jgi:type VI secretion system secreted protein Hcp
MPADTFLEFKGKNAFEGESTDAKFPRCIEIISFQIGMTNAGSGATGGGSGVNKVNFDDITIQKYVDKSSPNFMMCCANGAHIDKAFIHVRKAGENPQKYLTITMEEVFISSFSVGGGDGQGLPVDHIALNFSKIEFKYSPQNKDGSLGAANPKGWDLKASQPYAA